MTKLIQWLLGASMFFSIWVSMVRNVIGSKILEEWMQLVIAMPVIVIGMFGVYAASVVLWRVYTFNDCEDAAKELQKQIILAKEDLRLKGFIFETADKKLD